MLRSRHAPRTQIVLPLLFLLLAAFTRLWYFNEVPPGLSSDEVLYAQEGRAILEHGDIRFLYTANHFHEGSIVWMMAASELLLGPSTPAIRFPALWISLITLALLYRLTRAWFGSRTALIVLGLTAINFWAVFMGRTSLRINLLLLVSLIAMWGIWRTTYQRFPMAASPIQRRFPAILTGIALGLAAYTYTAWPILYLVFGGFVVALAILDRPTLRTRWHNLLTAAVIGFIIALPMIFSIVSDPQNRAALASIADPYHEAQAGNWGRILFNARVLAEVPFYIGDPSWQYNAADRPLFATIYGLFVYVGIAMCVWQIRRKPIMALVLGLLVFGAVPSLITRAAPSFTRGILMYPALVILIALPIDGVAQLNPPSKVYRRTAWALGILAIAVTASVDWPAYYVFWPHTDEVRAIYRDDLRLLAKYLSNQHESTVYLITNDPTDTDIYRYSKLQTDPTKVIWLDGMWLDSPFPSILNEQPTLLFVAPDAKLSMGLKGMLSSDKAIQFLGPANAPDGKRMFDLYRLPAK